MYFVGGPMSVGFVRPALEKKETAYCAFDI